MDTGQVLMAIGELKGELRGHAHATRQAVLDQTAATNLRIDDLRRDSHAMHRDLSGRLGRLEHSQSSTGRPTFWRWLADHAPWAQVLLGILSLLSTWGLIDKRVWSWLKILLTGQGVSQ